MNRGLRNAVLVAILSLTASVVYGQEKETDRSEKSRSGIAFFEAKIRPALVKHCYRCHSAESGKSRGGLKLDSRLSVLRGGDSGPALVPGKPEKSRLIQVIGYKNRDLQMPPKGKLPDSVIADFREWVTMGAPDPRAPAVRPPVRTEIDIEKGRNHWAYQKPVQPTLPKVHDKSWPQTEIDYFILSALEQKELKPVGDARPPVLVRRLYFVLTGLPPTAKEATRWTKAIAGAASVPLRQKVIARLVEELLSSPSYGEHWGRHWMDVARFAESTGGDANSILPHAWRYRDYVIDAFNEDKPFDRFVLEQLAGDLLPIQSDKEWGRNVVATGFLALGVKLVAEEDGQKFFADMVDEQIDATTRAFLATTVACARCHDHKFDPIPQVDYYAMAGMFRSTTTHFGLIKAQARQTSPLLDLTGMGLPADRKAISMRELDRLRKDRDAALERFNRIMTRIRGQGRVQRSVLLRSRTARDRAEVALQKYDEKGKPRIFAMGAQDQDYPVQTRLLIRGELDKPAQKVKRGFLQVLSKPGQHQLAKTVKGSGRLEMARWIASRENPLTARVMANRVWHHLFGRGIIRTVDDFGKTGEAPTHPQLLDHLALRLVKRNWSIKSLIREIVLSRAWQLSSDFSKASFAIDPDNRFLWRMSKRRLEAEAMRDAMLTVSGNLNNTRPLGSYLSTVGEGTIGRAVYEPEIRKITSSHRSVYLPRARNVLPEVLELFDAPDASLVMGARETTTTPLQALYLMNNPFVQAQAEGLAQQLSRHPVNDQVKVAYQMAFGRSPTEAEKRFAIQFTQRFKKIEARENANGSQHKLLTAYCQSLLCTAEFRMID